MLLLGYTRCQNIRTHFCHQRLSPPVGLEPTTTGLKGQRSTNELDGFLHYRLIQSLYKSHLSAQISRLKHRSSYRRLLNSSNTVSAPNIVLALAVPCLPLVHLSVVPTLGTGKTTTKRLEDLLYNINFSTAICHSLHTNACKVQQHFCTFLASREYWYSLLLKERCMSMA